MRYERDRKSIAEVEKQERKRRNQEAIAIASAKVKRLSSESNYLTELADKRARECKNKAPSAVMKLMAESNALRDAFDGKKREICEAEKELQTLKNKFFQFFFGIVRLFWKFFSPFNFLMFCSNGCLKMQKDPPFSAPAPSFGFFVSLILFLLV